MGVLDRLRSWLAAAVGRGGPEIDEGDETDADPRLDPENVTEVRKNAEDDPAAKLTDIRERQTDDEDEADG